MKNITPDNGIPVLTEIISPSYRESREETGMVEPHLVPVPMLTEKNHTADAEAQAIASWIDDEWNHLERKIRERVLHQIVGRVDFVLDQRIRDSMAEILQIAVEKMAIEIRQGLHQTLEEVIKRAVSQEIARINTPKN